MQSEDQGTNGKMTILENVPKRQWRL